MPLGMEVGLSPGHTVLDRDPAPPPQKGAQPITDRVSRWLGSLVGRALDSRLGDRGFSSWPPRQILGWVTVFGRAYHLSVLPSHPRQLSLLPSLPYLTLPSR